MKKSILEGVCKILDAWLGITHPSAGKPEYNKKSLVLELSENNNWNPDQYAGFLGETLIRRIDHNWNTSRVAGKSNWILRKRTEQAVNAEDLLERALSESLDDTWGNQIPTSSGLITESSDKKRNIDLFHSDGELMELVELKVSSSTDTPISAAFQIINYCMLFIHAKRNSESLLKHLNTTPSPKHVILSVLCPEDYWDRRYALKHLVRKLNIELACFKQTDGIDIEFRFQSLPWKSGDETKSVSSIFDLFNSRKTLF